MNTTKIKNAKSGSSLILALVLIFAVSAGAAIVYEYTANQARMSKKTIDMLKARSIAESGINITYAKLKNDISKLNNGNWAEESFDGGKYNIHLNIIASNRMSLISIGNYNGVESKVRADLRYYPSEEIMVNPSSTTVGTIYGPYIYNHSLYVGGTCTWRGRGTFGGGNVYVNGLIDLGGNGTWVKSSGSTLKIYSSTKINTFGSGEIVCDSVIAPEITQKKSDGIIGALVISSVSAPVLPEIELSPFYQHAYKNGQVKTGNFSVPSGYVPVGGILWCDGTLDFKGKVTGCFIATAGITLEAGAEVKPINPNWPTLYNKAGDINFTGQAETYGFIYTGGNVKFAGGGAMQDGPVIIKGNLEKRGNSDMIDNIPSTGFVIIPPVVNPQQISNTVERLVITGWQ
jgi:hypothetical protein